MYLTAKTFEQAVMMAINEMAEVTDKCMVTVFYPAHTIEVEYETEFIETRPQTYHHPQEGYTKTHVYRAELISDNGTRDVSEYFEL